MDPLPESLEQTSFTLGSEFQEAGYDFSMGPYADYQAELILQSPDGGEATAVCSYKSNGHITSIRSLSGDLGLLKQLREALERVQS